MAAGYSSDRNDSCGSTSRLQGLVELGCVSPAQLGGEDHRLLSGPASVSTSERGSCVRPGDDLSKISKGLREPTPPVPGNTKCGTYSVIP